MSRDIDALRQRETVLVLRQQAAASRSTRHDEMLRFIRTLIGPAVRGDEWAREKLLPLLTPIQFPIPRRLRPCAGCARSDAEREDGDNRGAYVVGQLRLHRRPHHGQCGPPP
jgi:hypothetical protein